MNYAKIVPCDIANGPSVRVTLFVQGCNHHCPGCQNPTTWDPNGGQPFTDETLDKITKFMNKTIIWGLGIVLTIFVSVSSMESSITKGVDALTVKTTKATVSNVIPIVGKILGDAVDTVLSCTNILKNAVGMVGVFVVISICMVPIIKLLTLMGVYYLGAALCQPIADEKIIKLLEQIGGTFKLLLAIMCSIFAMVIIGLTIVIKISSVG